MQIVQAPMANNQPPGFAALACDAGVLGTVAAGYWSADQLREELALMGNRRYGINLFAAPYLDEDTLAVAIEARPAVLSFAFGIVDVAPLHDAGIEAWGTATSAEEAQALVAAGVDAVIAQGAEAGGHRGSFLDGFPLVPLDELLQEIDVGVPVIAAGGIVDRGDVHAMRELGASGVQVGTAFLFTHECARPQAHLDALRAYDTVVTDAYTGRPMRAAGDDVLRALMDGPPPLPFGQQRAVSAQRGPLYMGGTAARRCRLQSAAELVAELLANPRGVA